MSNRPICFIDVETTGLDPDEHELLEVAAVLVDSVTLKEMAHFESKVKPVRMELADEKALEINGYTPERWQEARPLGEALWRMRTMVSGAVVAGHNVAFDWAFLEVGWFVEKIAPPAEMSYRRIDTMSVAAPLFQVGATGSMSLAAVCSALGISNDGAHTAMADARRSLEVYRRMVALVEQSL